MILKGEGGIALLKEYEKSCRQKDISKKIKGKRKPLIGEQKFTNCSSLNKKSLKYQKRSSLRTANNICLWKLLRFFRSLLKSLWDCQRRIWEKQNQLVESAFITKVHHSLQVWMRSIHSRGFTKNGNVHRNQSSERRTRTGSASIKLTSCC